MAPIVFDEVLVFLDDCFFSDHRLEEMTLQSHSSNTDMSETIKQLTGQNEQLTQSFKVSE